MLLHMLVKAVSTVLLDQCNLTLMAWFNQVNNQPNKQTISTFSIVCGEKMANCNLIFILILGSRVVKGSPLYTVFDPDTQRRVTKRYDNAESVIIYFFIS